MVLQLARARKPTHDQYVRDIERAYPGIEAIVLDEQEAFISLSETDYARLKQQLLDNWPAIQEIAATVPAPQQLVTWLLQAGGESHLSALGFSEAEIQEAVRYSHLLRNRFNVNKLWHLFGLQII